MPGKLPKNQSENLSVPLAFIGITKVKDSLNPEVDIFFCSPSSPLQRAEPGLGINRGRIQGFHNIKTKLRNDNFFSTQLLPFSILFVQQFTWLQYDLLTVVVFLWIWRFVYLMSFARLRCLGQVCKTRLNLSPMYLTSANVIFPMFIQYVQIFYTQTCRASILISFLNTY